jgi:hypothetical protein
VRRKPHRLLELGPASSLNDVCVIAGHLPREKMAQMYGGAGDRGSLLMKRPLGISGTPLVSTTPGVGAFGCSPYGP